MEDRALGQLIAQALLPAVRLELLPKASVDIFVTVFEDDGPGGVVAAATVAAGAALAHAGVEMLALVTSCCAERS